MINPTKNVKITITKYALEIIYPLRKYHDSDCFSMKESLNNMYINKYSNRNYQSILKTFPEMTLLRLLTGKYGHNGDFIYKIEVKQ